jgi:hypothetical protein
LAGDAGLVVASGPGRTPQGSHGVTQMAHDFPVVVDAAGGRWSGR